MADRDDITGGAGHGPEPAGVKPAQGARAERNVTHGGDGLRADGAGSSRDSGKSGPGGGARNGQEPVVRVSGVSLHYGKTEALDDVSLEVPSGCMVGLIGPDGVGKSSLLALVSGVQVIQRGEVFVLGGDMGDKKHRERVCAQIAYMPQGLGKNLYPTLSVEENLQFFARLFGHGPQERRKRIDGLTRATGLNPFLDRAAGKLSGGMKQKLGLCCALIHDPDLLILDEPTTGVDPLARSQFWELIAKVRESRPSMSVMVATAYMDEARGFDWLVAMNAGHILDTGTPDDLLERTGADNLEQAFINLMPEDERKDYKPVEITPLESEEGQGEETTAGQAADAEPDNRPETEESSVAGGKGGHEPSASGGAAKGTGEEAGQDSGPGTAGGEGKNKAPGTEAIRAENLTKRFGKFTAVDSVSFSIAKGEIFGFLGSNGSGKTTTMKMLTGLLPATEGQVWLFGKEVKADGSKSPDGADNMEIRQHLGYMTQAFSLYGELTVRQNLVLHARLFSIPEKEVEKRTDEMLRRFNLARVEDTLPENLPLGVRQRLSLAVAVIHSPDILILDEPTSGVDPIARDDFWRLIIELSRKDKVTIFITTHFMNEAERCDRISLMHDGKVLDSDKPEALVRKKDTEDLEQAFIAYLKEAGAGQEGGEDDQGEEQDLSEVIKPEEGSVAGEQGESADKGKSMNSGPGDGSGKAADEEGRGGGGRRELFFSPRRFYSAMWRESLELRRDPIRLTLALLGSLILMLVMGYGITMDIEDLTFAVLDRDQTGLSRNYALNISGSRYFIEKEPITDYAQLDRRMRSAEITLAVELPPGFARDVQRGQQVSIGVWIDGAMPQRAETIRGYVQGMHQVWLAQQARERNGHTETANATVEIRYRYNPDVKSLPAMVPAVIPLLMLMLPAMLSALSVVREKELGSIINLYTTPLTKTEFLIGKQLPYVALAMLSFLLMTLLAVTLFDVPIKGSFLTLALAALIFCVISTGMGLLASTFMRSQIAVMFVTMIGTMLPAIQFSGLLNTVSSLEGAGRVIGSVYPATYMLIITRGVFNKALGLADLYPSILMLLITVPVILTASIMLLKKQEGSKS